MPLEVKLGPTVNEATSLIGLRSKVSVRLFSVWLKKQSLKHRECSWKKTPLHYIMA